MLIEDVEYVIFQHPDIDAARQFLLDYGLLDLERGSDRVYLRSYGEAPFSYVTTKGDAAFVGLGFRLANRDALEKLAVRFNSPIADCPHPGGGLMVATSDPDGRKLEFVFGAARLALFLRMALRSSGTTPSPRTVWAVSSALAMALRMCSVSAMRPFSRPTPKSSSPGIATISG